jgi:hypothetical protein
MLVDVHFRRPDPVMSIVLAAIAGNGPIIPERIGEGMYLCGHWSIDQLGVPIRERWKEDEYKPLGFDDCGVCDTPEQAIEKLKLRDRPERMFVSFVRLRAADQPREGGWRWRKWGAYIGDKTPQMEYLHDEPEIQEVYTFHVYELA